MDEKSEAVAAWLRWVDEIHLESHFDPTCRRCVETAKALMDGPEAQHVGA